MVGVLKVVVFFGICIVFVVVLIVWYFKGNFVFESVWGKKVVICGVFIGIGEEFVY